MSKIRFTVSTSHKVGKNSHVIMKGSTFVLEMIPAKRFFLFFLFLQIFSFCLSATTLKPAGEFSPFKSNGKFGLKNQNGDVVIPAEYDALGWSDGKFSVVENVTGYSINGLWGLINLSNHKVTRPEYIELSAQESALIVARKKIRNSIQTPAGCINSAGKIIIPFNYDGIVVSGLRAIVYQKSGLKFSYGLIDFKNEVIIPLSHQRIFPLGTLRFGVVSTNGKTGIFSETGEQLSPFDLDSISSYRKNYAVTYQNFRQGLIDRDGKIVLRPEFRNISVNEEGKVSVQRYDAWLILDGENKTLRQTTADLLVPVSPGLYELKLAGIYQLVNKELEPVGQGLFTDVREFERGKAVVRIGERTGVVRQNGSFAVKPVYRDISIEGNLIRASEIFSGLTKWLLLDTAGSPITQKKYDYIGGFNGKFFPSKNKGFWGALDKKGKEFVACVHDSIVSHSEDHIVVKFKRQYGIISMKEEWLVTPQPNRLHIFGPDRYIEQTPTHKFLKSFSGDVIYFTENHVDVKDDHLLEHTTDAILKITRDGVIAATYPLSEGREKIYPEIDGYRAIRKDGKSGFVDNRGRLRIANRYEDVTFFSEGLAGAKLLGKWGFINKEDKIAIQPVYDEVMSFNKGVSIVRQKNLYGLIDKTGKVILPVRFEKIEMLSSDRYLVAQDGLVGLAGHDGKMILNPKFDRLQDLNNGYIICERDGKFGVITTKGISTIPMMYDLIVFDRLNDQYLAQKKSTWEPADL